MKTRKISTNNARPGMIVSEDVFTPHNQMIIAKNTPLTDRIITRLKFYSIMEFSILLKDEDSTISSDPSDYEPTYSEYIRKSPEFTRFNNIFKQSVQSFRETLNSIVSNNTDIQSDKLLIETNRVIAESRNSYHVFSMLHCMRDYDDLTYVHSLNVSLICNIFGKWLNLPDEEIAILSLCGLLHDIGKIAIPPHIIMKPTKLTETEYTTVKTHTIKGYEILKDKNVNENVKLTALMHHERCDGSGYPYGLMSDKINKFAKIVGIADIYDAMTSARIYRGPLCPFEVIEVFETEGYAKYDPHYIITFLNGIIQTYMNNHVILSDGTEGKIVMINRRALSKPIIQTKTRFIDLSTESKLSIVQIV